MLSYKLSMYTHKVRTNKKSHDKSVNSNRIDKTRYSVLY